MSAKNEVFDKTYTDYLAKLEELDLAAVAGRLGLDVSGGELLVRLLGEDYQVTKAGVFDSAGEKVGLTVGVVIFKYLLMCPDSSPEEGGWTTYHSFKDAQPLLHYFARETTGPIERRYGGRLEELRQACLAAGGVDRSEAGAYDLSVQFELLSRIPLFLRFNDADDEFPAQCTVLFRQSVERYLDMESLGILGALFARKLVTAGGM